MTFKAPSDTDLNAIGGGARFGYASPDPSKEASIIDAQRRFAEANPSLMHGYIIVVCQDVEGDPNSIETVVDFGGTPSIKNRMLRGLIKAAEHDMAATAIVNGEQQKEQA